MKKVIGMMLALTFFAGCYSTSSVVKKPIGSLADEKRPKIALVDFENKSGDPANDVLMASISGTMISELQKTGTFRIIERQRLETILSELKLNMSGMVEPKNVKRVGQQLGVDAFVFGNLSSVKYETSKSTIYIMWTEGQKTDIVLDARIVNVETGEVVASDKTSSYVKQRKWVAFGFAKLGKTIEKNSIIQTGIDLSCRQLALDLASQVSSQ